MELNLTAELDADVEKEYFQAIGNLFKQLENFLERRNYGDDVEFFVPILRVMDPEFVEDFTGGKKTRKYSKKHKTIIVVCDLDHQTFRTANIADRKTMIANGILSAIEESDSMRVKPKDYDKGRLYDDVKGFLKEGQWI